MNTTNRELFQFIADSPSCYHVIENTKRLLAAQNYKELNEHEAWTLKMGGCYYVTRNLSSIIAFQLPNERNGGFHITASHSDSPSFKLKEHAEIELDGSYVKLNVEKYGGMLMSSWLDRPLSIAGRVIVKDNGCISTKLVNIDKDMVMIPNLAIHMNRDANDGYKYNPQIDLLPLYGSAAARDTFMKNIAAAAQVSVQNILGSDLFLYNRMAASVWGADDEFISSPKLDDLQCAFSSLQALLDTKAGSAIPVHCVLDNEEVGSGSKQGAASTFLKDTLMRICTALDPAPEYYHRMLAESFMVSADNAHAVHPNQADKADITNRPYMNKGIVIKYSANQKYTTDGISAAIFKSICEKAKVPFQSFFNRSDLTGGSTLGNISNTQVPVNTVDIGLAQLAMHSAYETAGASDTQYMIQALKVFNQSQVICLKDGSYRIC